MSAESFAYWLQGFVELNPESYPTPAQWKMIKEHLETVFTKVTPKLDILQDNFSKRGEDLTSQKKCDHLGSNLYNSFEGPFGVEDLKIKFSETLKSC